MYRMSPGASFTDFLAAGFSVMRKLIIPAVIAVVLVGVALLWILSRTPESRYDSQDDPLLNGAADVAEVPTDSDSATSHDLRRKRSHSELRDAVEATSLAAVPALYGRVSDGYGNPLAGARIYLREGGATGRGGGFGRGGFDERRMRARLLGEAKVVDESALEATTNTAGDYMIPLSQIPAGSYYVLARYEELAPQIESWTRTDVSDELNFALESAGETVTGVVFDTNGEPIAGAFVDAEPEGRFGSVPIADRSETASDGSFRLRVPAGTYQIQAEAIGFRTNSVDDVEAGTEGIELVLGPAGNVRGRVVDAANKPIANAAVAIVRSGRGGFGSRTAMLRLFRNPTATTQTDGAGSFAFSNLPRREYAVLVERENFVPGTKSVLFDEDTNVELGDLVLETAQRLEGVVTDAGGAPVARAFVAVGTAGDEERRFGGRGGRRRGGRGDDEDEEENAAPRPLSPFSLAAATETDGTGKFRFTTLAEGTYNLTVEADDFIVERLEDIALSDNKTRSVTVELDSGAALTGVVTSADDQSPVKDATVRVRVGRRQARDAKTDAEGRYTIGGLTGTTLDDISVDASGFSLELIDSIDVDAEGSTTLDIHLQRAASLRGVVLDDDKNPVYNARVRVIPEAEEASNVAEPEGDRGRGRRDADRFRAMRRRFQQAASVRSGPDGSFHFVEVNAGLTYTVQIEHPEFKDFESERFTVSNAEQVDGLEYVLSRGSALIVYVRDVDGLPLPGTRVSARRVEETAETEAERSGNGEESRRVVATFADGAGAVTGANGVGVW